MARVRIWDLPTRLFHWLLAGCVLGLVITGNIGGNAMTWHFRLGYAVLTLLLFRFVWGFAGGYWSRWSRLALAPAQVLAYLSGRLPGGPGHNPLGSWSVLCMLLGLLLQVSTGLLSDDEISNAGPLSALVSGATVSAATAWHKGPGKLVLLVLVLTHLGAIVWYRVRRREALVPPMLHGDKALSEPVPASADGTRARLLALLIVLLCALGVSALVSLGAP